MPRLRTVAGSTSQPYLVLPLSITPNEPPPPPRAAKAPYYLYIITAGALLLALMCFSDAADARRSLTACEAEKADVEFELAEEQKAHSATTLAHDSLQQAHAVKVAEAVALTDDNEDLREQLADAGTIQARQLRYITRLRADSATQTEALRTTQQSHIRRTALLRDSFSRVAAWRIALTSALAKPGKRPNLPPPPSTATPPTAASLTTYESTYYRHPPRPATPWYLSWGIDDFKVFCLMLVGACMIVLVGYLAIMRRRYRFRPGQKRRGK